MADTKASDETDASALSSADGFAIVQGGADRFATFGQVLDLALTSLGDDDAALTPDSDDLFPTKSAVKAYADAIGTTEAAARAAAIAAAVNGLSWKQAVRVATTVAGTLATSFENGDTIDGVVLATGNRILIKNQAAPAENGIYVVSASGAPTRSTDADSGAELVNASVYVSEGTTNADTQWTCTTNATITVGSTSLAFAQLSTGAISPTTTKGDLFGHSTVDARIPVGADGTALVSDSTLALGVGWKDLVAPYRMTTQAASARKYLDRQGTFRDPLQVGLGVITAGTIATITDDSKYNAWPVICRLRGNRLLLAYTKGDTHHGDTTGKAVYKVGTENLDGTISWGTETTIHQDTTPRWVSVYGITQLSSGRIIATLWRDTGSGTTGTAGYVYSDDNLATWTVWQDLGTPSGYSESYCTGPAVELPNGEVLVTLEVDNTGSSNANRSSILVRSSDGGTTFGTPTTIRLYATDTRPYYESKLLLLADDSLLIVHRCAASTPGNHYTQKSTDGGATWSVPVLAFTGIGAPSTILLSTGTLICTTRRNTTYSLICYTSTDNAATWSALTELDATMTEQEYAAPVELRDGRILIVYGFQPSGATTNCDIKGIICTESKAQVGGFDQLAGLGVRGDILYRGASGWARLAYGTSGYLLQTNGSGADPTWVVAPTGAGGTSSTWNPADKNASVALSGGNLIASATASTGAVRGTLGRNIATDHAYFEVVLSGLDNVYMIGVGKSTATLTSYTGSDANGWGYYGQNGNKYTSGSGSAYGTGYSPGDRIGVEINAGAITFWKNGVSQGSAFTGLTGTVYPMVAAGTASGTRNGAINTGFNFFPFGMPSGALAWG